MTIINNKNLLFFLQIEFEQGKLSKAEKDRDKILMTLEKEREDQQNEFHLLVNDCKMFAKQLIEQGQKEEHLLKEIEQEKRKNRVLSELMVEEQKKFKERIRIMEEERHEYHLFIQQKQELETRLAQSEQRAKEAHELYIQETQHVKLLEYELKQISGSSKDSSGCSENGDDLEDVVDGLKQGASTSGSDNELVDGELTITAEGIEARVLQTKPVLMQEHQSYVILQNSSIATVKKSNIVKPNKGSVSTTKPKSPERTAKITSTAAVVAAAAAANRGVASQLSSAEDIRNRKIPPPTPPRVSSITAKSVPVLSTEADCSFDDHGGGGHFVRSNSLGAESVRKRSSSGDSGTRYERRQTMQASGKLIILIFCVIYC